MNVKIDIVKSGAVCLLYNVFISNHTATILPELWGRIVVTEDLFKTPAAAPNHSPLADFATGVFPSPRLRASAPPWFNFPIAIPPSSRSAPIRRIRVIRVPFTVPPDNSATLPSPNPTVHNYSTRSGSDFFSHSLLPWRPLRLSGSIQQLPRRRRSRRQGT